MRLDDSINQGRSNTVLDLGPLYFRTRYKKLVLNIYKVLTFAYEGAICSLNAALSFVEA